MTATSTDSREAMAIRPRLRAVESPPPYDEQQTWRASWRLIADACDTALDGLPSDHPRRDVLVRATRAAHDAAKTSILDPATPGARMKPRAAEPVPRIALTLEEAATSLGMSLAHFRRHVLPDLKVVRSGSVRVVAVEELRRYVERESVLAGAAR